MQRNLARDRESHRLEALKRLHAGHPQQSTSSLARFAGSRWWRWRWLLECKAGAVVRQRMDIKGATASVKCYMPLLHMSLKEGVFMLPCNSTQDPSSCSLDLTLMFQDIFHGFTSLVDPSTSIAHLENVRLGWKAEMGLHLCHFAHHHCGSCVDGYHSVRCFRSFS